MCGARTGAGGRAAKRSGRYTASGARRAPWPCAARRRRRPSQPPPQQPATARAAHLTPPPPAPRAHPAARGRTARTASHGAAHRAPRARALALTSGGDRFVASGGLPATLVCIAGTHASASRMARRALWRAWMAPLARLAVSVCGLNGPATAAGATECAGAAHGPVSLRFLQPGQRHRVTGF